MDITKIPPHDIEAEQAVIGSMLTDKDAVMAAIEILKPEDFYRGDNKAIYQAIYNLYGKGEPIDIITVKSQLIEEGNFEKVGGIEYLALLPDKVPTTANVEIYIKIVEEKSILRSLIDSANYLLELGYAQTDDVNFVMDEAEKKIFNIMKNRNQKSYVPIKDILIDSFQQIEKMYNQKGAISGIRSGFIDLDHKTSGLNKSDLILVAARPAMGKSAFAINIATNVAVKSQVPVVIFNLEMSKEQVANRILCSEAMVDANKVKTGQMEDADWEKLACTLGPLSAAEIYIDDTPRNNYNGNKSESEKIKTREKYWTNSNRLFAIDSR